MQQKYKSKTLLQDTLVRHLFLLNMENQYFVNELRAKSVEELKEQGMVKGHE